MEIVLCNTKQELGQRAAEAGGEAIRQALKKRGEAIIIVATGASQFEMLSTLVTLPEIAWGQVTAFHLDEYAGMSPSHPASFRKYLQERFVEKLPEPLRAFHAIAGEGDFQAECQRLNAILAPRSVDVAFVGIGENGHLAFNDPPADFETEAPYIVVDLDEACRCQQLGEGWFATLDDVPRQAISMSVRQILKAETIIASVPDRRKAQAVCAALQGPVTPKMPSSILQQHAGTRIYLDPESASLLSTEAVPAEGHRP